jgi:hypothetical protein
MDVTMNRSLTLKVIFIAGALGILGACADKPGSEGWYDAMSDKKQKRVDRLRCQDLRDSLRVGKHYDW